MINLDQLEMGMYEFSAYIGIDDMNDYLQKELGYNLVINVSEELVALYVTFNNYNDMLIPTNIFVKDLSGNWVDVSEHLEFYKSIYKTINESLYFETKYDTYMMNVK